MEPGLSRSISAPDESLDALLALDEQIRRTEHWRRLVAARLDLAVAAVTDIDELPAQAPAGLRELLGIDRYEHRLSEAAVLPLLKGALADLDRHLAALRQEIAQLARG